VEEAGARLDALLDWAAEHGGGFAVLWHSEQYDSALLPGWDRLYRRLMEDVRARGGVCIQAGTLAEEARAWLS
jgi:alkanesulfonate monooxygenase SsuD/methylene tetrahydromethanopterin reductase-like flavin-dependent oxidoreductase (luciferase family)